MRNSTVDEATGRRRALIAGILARLPVPAPRPRPPVQPGAPGQSALSVRDSAGELR